MTLLEKINNSASSTLFTLYKEGLFYKCYNQDAMVFAKHIKPYKIISKYFKNVGAEVSSLGFPASEAEKGKLSFEIMQEKLSAVRYDIENDKVIFHLKTDLKQDFENWRNNVAMEKDEDYISKPEITNNISDQVYYIEIIAMIKQFDLANSTPMEGLSFIQQLKKGIQKMDVNHGNL